MDPEDHERETGHLGPRTTRPRTTRTVSPDYSDRVTDHSDRVNSPLGSSVSSGMFWLFYAKY